MSSPIIGTPPISAGELDQLQSDVQSLMDLKADIYRNTPTQGPTGNVVENYAKIHSNVMCSMSEPTSTQLQNYDYLIGSLNAWQVRLPISTDIQATDHIVVSSQTLEVQVVLQPRSHQVHTRVLASEVKEF